MTQHKFTKQKLAEWIGLTTAYPWSEVYLEIICTQTHNGTTQRIYINGSSTPFKASGYGYCMRSTVLNDFCNYYVGKDLYNAGGAGVDTLQQQIKDKGNLISLEYITETKGGWIYKVTNLQRPAITANLGGGICTLAN